jgi:cyclic beta-1,2-glucan synthetase
LLAGPIRGELLGAEHLAERAQELAESQRLSARPARRRTPLLARLNGTRGILEDAEARLTAASDGGVDVGPAGDWLLDNYHVVQEHIGEVRESLPRGYYRELPVLSGGSLAGYPRIYELAITLISHTEGRIDLENVSGFVEAFQEIAVLTIGELWAMPAMLRLGLIENVRRMALRTVHRLDEIEAADAAAAGLATAGGEGSASLEAALARFASDPPPLTPTFVSRFLHQLRVEGAALPAVVRLEQWISEEALSAEEATARATQRLALTQVVMANSITSLRAIARMDWKTFVERRSRMEAVLREDPSGFYALMTFATRDHYRHTIERIARRTRRSEESVARHAVDCARLGKTRAPDDPRQQHIGYYIADDGLVELERLTGYRPKWGETAYRWVRRHPNAVFGGGVATATLAALAAVLWLGGPMVRADWLAVLLLSLIPANDIAVNVVNQLVTAFLPPRRLPKLDLHEHGVPPEFRTAVVIPTLFGSVDAVREALQNLEVQFLANREAHLHFAVLSDFTDAAAESRPDDDAITVAAVEGVRALNARYAPDTQDAFYLFHRPRRWNPHEGVWMGWERKRGKLAEFNRFVLTGAREAFSVLEGDVAPMRSVRYVITLDADTVLPPDAAPLLVGALAHPLNRAVYDPVLGRVVRGYGILQPRVGVSLPSAHRSIFAAIHSGHPGVDPYTTAVSDVYQDLYGEGSFTGKGVYDVEAFERATHGRFPENTLLSHDLIEGNYARAGLATDVIVYDDYPTRYLTFTRRKHRWIRGDWQLLPWLTATVPGPGGPERNRLSFLSRWKIIDNLRRSTTEIALLAFLAVGWTLLSVPPLRWTLLGLGALAAPWLVSLLLAVLRPPLDKSWRAYYAAVGRDAATSMRQLGLAIVFLPHQAFVSADAIVRTLWRMAVSHRHLLEWRTASQIERGMTDSARVVWGGMWPAVALAGVVLAAVAWQRGTHTGPGTAPWWLFALAVVPLLAAWLAAPSVAQALSAPVERRDRRLPPNSRRQALHYALLHWRFFDRFVTAESAWLAPDNFQETPEPVVALRTSPTNVGLQLLATVSAFDLGFVSLDDMLRRLELVFRTLERMRRFRGHLYNWYDLRDLSVMEPAYVSTVDSGNLAGHLIALRQACLALADGPIVDPRIWHALDTSLTLADERLLALPAEAAALEHLRSARAALALAGEPVTAAALAAIGTPLASAEAALAAARLAPEVLAPAVEWITWSRRLAESQRELLGGLDAAPAESLRRLAPTWADAASFITRLETLADRAATFAMEMDFRFLFDGERKLFAIGFQQATHSLDGSYYDLLASESRLASFMAIAKNDVPAEHWFRLGRRLTYAAGEPALVSWSGSMFEYLMPMLVMRSFPDTVLAQTCAGALERQVAYGAERNVPWGVSESAYNVRDRHQTYQYRPFGVPDLALKRGLGRELVVAPYASVLATMIDPQRALANLARLEDKGTLGPYGFRDAVDYTRPDDDGTFAVVRTYMAHHMGMGLVALTNTLAGQVWQERFHADPVVRSAELLLHERIPRRLVLQEPQGSRRDESMPEAEIERPAVRELDGPDTANPHVALLGHLPYTIMVSHCGGGYSRYESLAVTRWQSDGTRDASGQFCYVKDLATGRVWSAAHQPVCAPADWYRAYLATDRVTFHRADGDIETRTEIAVVPEDSAEVRRVTLTNNGDTPRELELTSYGEIVLSPPEADRAHPAFGNLFVETEWHDWCWAITATRRPRSATEQSLWCVHVVDDGRERLGDATCESDRARFLGRGRSTRDPAALEADGPLSGSTGAVLDPVFAIRTRVRLAPGQSASVAYTTLVAPTRDRAFELADRYHDPHAAQRALDLAWTSSQVELRELGLTPGDAAVFQELAGHLFYGGSALRAPQAELRRNRGSQPLLWATGVSGDWPILLATIDEAEGLPTLRQLLAAHRYWRRRGMTVDLVVLDGHAPSYLQDLGDRITAAVYSVADGGSLDRPGGVFVRRRDLVGADELLMLRATARVHIACDGRPLGRILATVMPTEVPSEDEFDPPAPEIRAPARSDSRVIRAVRLIGSRLPTLLSPLAYPPGTERRMRPRRSGTAARAAFENGFGELSPDGDYEIEVCGDHVPPAPWSNVIANPHGGFVITERGGGFTWAANSFFYRLTPWSNDPASDPVTEAVYLRDEETGELWCATPGPVRVAPPYSVRHGAGSTTFEHVQRDIATVYTLGMAEDAALKIAVLRVTNTGSDARRLALTSYVEWSLGVLREHTQHQVRTVFDRAQQVVLAQNTFDPQFASWTAFHAMSETVTAHTASRREFLGRNGTAAAPAALRAGATLSGATGSGIDPCAALQCTLELQPGESREIVFLLGAAADETAARALLGEYRDVGRAEAALEHTAAGWTKRLSAVTVRTPEPTFDAMLNRWSLYQALACRLWGRSAFYQSGGAYGFRDQLQDVMALVYAEPALAREHILRATARQFLEGDVQHWWHPPSGRGVRTRFSDDLVWLPYVVDHYVRSTGDASVLDQYVPFLTMRPLEPGEHEVYDLPQVTDEHGSVYEHCLRALRRASTAGVHGLPLIGSGDWNDGMNRVGVEGRGESVWLAWFLVTTLRAFAVHAEARGDLAVAGEFRRHADAYAVAVETHGWDGAWYRRAYFDDGTPLGSIGSDECRIDSIAQSWSVISGAGDPHRQAQAMRSLEEHLVREDARLLLLLTPPFDHTPHDPGYIKGYLPGVRENGAQYTHAALWAVLATAIQGYGDRAFELFQMLNPLTHARTPEEVATYKVEPYVVAADVYTAEGQLGRGGWTWYTGSASWMYRVGLEGILGLRKRGDTLYIEPRAPAAWPEYTIEYRHGQSRYVIVVHHEPGEARGPMRVTVDGVTAADGIRLVDDGREHAVEVRREGSSVTLSQPGESP